MAREQQVNGCAEGSSFSSQYAPIVMRAIDVASWPEPEATLAPGGVRCPGSTCRRSVGLDRTATSPISGAFVADRKVNPAHNCRKKSIMAALTSDARSCWVQWPQPGSMNLPRSRGTSFAKLAMTRSMPWNPTTKSRSPAM